MFSPLARGRAAKPGFAAYVALTAGLSAAMFALFAWRIQWGLHPLALFGVLSAFVLIGELLPIPVPRRNGLTTVTISTAFAFAMLIRFGPAPAMCVYVAGTVIADASRRGDPIKILFNAAQYALAVAAAGAVLILAGVHPPLDAIAAHQVPALLAAGAAFFLVNHALACTGAALVAGLPIPQYIRDDLAFQAWTGGCLLAFAPAVVASSHSTLALVPVCFVPLLAVYVGGRQAAVNTHRAYHDALTELPNRALFAETLQAKLAIAERERRSVAVMLLDVDDFKTVNDTLGHEFGDAVLMQIAQRLKGAIREDAILARFGGDEFALAIDCGPAEAQVAARRLLRSLDQPMDVDWLSLSAAGSIGIACFPEHGRSVAELLRHADVAMYRAKASDVSCAAYAEEHDAASIDRLALAAQLRRGIERGEVGVHYQPKVPLDGGATAGVEALARWSHPQLGAITPDGFIPLAEETGVIKPLTECVLELSLRQCRIWRLEGLEITVSVNVSWRNLLDHDLPATIERLLERYDLPASALALEITESRIVADLRRARRVLEQLRAMGVRIAIDDFGTGFSSLSQLRTLPIDEIKIDRSFVTRLEANRSDEILVKSIVELGRNLGLTVTAEGIESEEVSTRLREFGCDFGQGFHIARPAPAEDCRQYLGAHAPVRPVTLAAVAEA